MEELFVIQATSAMRLHEVQFAFDCKVLMDNINITVEDFSQLGSTLHDCRSLLSVNQTFHISYVRKQANGVARVLTRTTPSFSSL